MYPTHTNPCLRFWKYYLLSYPWFHRRQILASCRTSRYRASLSHLPGHWCHSDETPTEPQLYLRVPDQQNQQHIQGVQSPLVSGLPKVWALRSVVCEHPVRPADCETHHEASRWGRKLSGKYPWRSHGVVQVLKSQPPRYHDDARARVEGQPVRVHRWCSYRWATASYVTLVKRSSTWSFTTLIKHCLFTF